MDPRDGEDEGLFDEDDVGDHGELPQGVRSRLEAFLPEIIKRSFAAGMGAVLTTEDGLRKLTKDLPLPKEVAGYLANTAGATKDEVVRIMAREFREFLQTVNVSEEIAKMLTLLSFEVKTEIRFIPNDEKFGGVEPDVKAKVRLKRNEAAGETRRSSRFKRRREEADGEEDDGGTESGAAKAASAPPKSDDTRKG